MKLSHFCLYLLFAGLFVGCAIEGEDVDASLAGCPDGKVMHCGTTGNICWCGESEKKTAIDIERERNEAKRYCRAPYGMAEHCRDPGSIMLDQHHHPYEMKPQPSYP